LIATEPAETAPGPVRSRPRDRDRAGLATSHSRTVPSLLPLARARPPGLNATELIAAGPLVRIQTRRGREGSATSHNQTVPSPLPLASMRPPGPNATELIAAMLPVRTV